MPLDPANPIPVGDTRDRTVDRLGALERRVSRLERDNPTMHTTGSQPTALARDGAHVLQTNNSRLWLRSNGAWRYIDTLV